jgi:death-on-curing protein
LANEPRWLTPGEIEQLNALIVAETGEPHGVRDLGMLESACHRPHHRHIYEDTNDVVVLACDLLFGVAQNHPFLQGNKRTGFEAALLFLDANGYDFVADDRVELAEMIVAVVTGALPLEAFEAYVRPYVVPLHG